MLVGCDQIAVTHAAWHQERGGNRSGGDQVSGGQFKGAVRSDGRCGVGAAAGPVRHIHEFYAERLQDRARRDVAFARRCGGQTSRIVGDPHLFRLLRLAAAGASRLANARPMANLPLKRSATSLSNAIARSLPAMSLAVMRRQASILPDRSISRSTRRCSLY